MPSTPPRGCACVVEPTGWSACWRRRGRTFRPRAASSMRSWTSGLRVLFVLGWVYPCTRSGGYDGKADAPCGVRALIHKSFKCSTLHSHTRTQTHLPLRRSIKTSLTFISTVCDLLLRYGIDECSAASIQTFRLFRSILRRHASEV